MAETVIGMLWLIPLLPLLAAAILAGDYLLRGNRGEAAERGTARIAVAATAGSLLGLLLIDGVALLQGVPGNRVVGAWFGSGKVQFNWSFLADGLGLSLATLVALIALLTLRFSINYMHREAGFQRFFMLMSLFSGAMLLIVLAGNALLTFVGWELAGLSSYLLIGYAFDREGATRNANRALITNRIGDAGFILALFLTHHYLGDLEWTTLAGRGDELSTLAAGLIAASFLIAALAKSAQLPFAPWIARALEGPTPSSAIFYGSLMVHAGVYLLLRLEPLLVREPLLMLLLVLVGALTALYGWLVALVQTDIKSALIFSTIGQVGLMFLWAGLGWFDLAAGHLLLHAVWRGYQFLNAPGMMHLMGRPARPVPLWLQRRQWPYTAALQRFWFDPLADWLLVRPTEALARDVKEFDERFVNRLAGLAATSGTISSLAQWDRRRIGDGSIEGDHGTIGQGRGIAGRLLEGVATLFHWFEERLVLRGGGEGVLAGIHYLGRYLTQVEGLLSRPRYLLLMVMATIVVII